MAATPLDGKHVAVGKVDHPVFLWYRTLRANIVTGQQRPVETHPSGRVGGCADTGSDPVLTLPDIAPYEDASPHGPVG